MSTISAQGSAGSMFSSDYAVDMARAWRTDNVAQDYMKGEEVSTKTPDFVRAPSQAFTIPNPTAPLAPPPAPTAAIAALLAGMEERIRGEVGTLRAQISTQSAQLTTQSLQLSAQTTEIGNLRGQVTALTGKVTDLTTQVTDLSDTIKAVNKQVSNLVSMGYCDKLKTLVPCCNHLKNVSVRGLTAKELELVQKSKTLQQPGVK